MRFPKRIVSLSVAVFGALLMVSGAAALATPGVPSLAAPEIDPGSIAGAASLLGSGLFILRGRRAR